MVKPQKRSQRQRQRHTHRDTYATHKEITNRDKERERENTERNGGTDTETQTWIPEIHRQREEMERICLINVVIGVLCMQFLDKLQHPFLLLWSLATNHLISSTNNNKGFL
jgi:hypothetical protein